MKLYRLSRAQYSHELSGIGASLWGGRWNSKGTELIYTAESRALALAEVVVHLAGADLPEAYMMMEIELPDGLPFREVLPSDLPADWFRFPPVLATKKAGDHFFLEADCLLLKVPSAVVEGDFNWLIHPYHSEFKNVRISKVQPFRFDQRLIGNAI